MVIKATPVGTDWEDVTEPDAILPVFDYCDSEEVTRPIRVPYRYRQVTLPVLQSPSMVMLRRDHLAAVLAIAVAVGGMVGLLFAVAR